MGYITLTSKEYQMMLDAELHHDNQCHDVEYAIELMAVGLQPMAPRGWSEARWLAAIKNWQINGKPNN